MSVLIRFSPPSLTAEQYDSVVARLRSDESFPLTGSTTRSASARTVASRSAKSGTRKADGSVRSAPHAHPPGIRHQSRRARNRRGAQHHQAVSRGYPSATRSRTFRRLRGPTATADRLLPEVAPRASNPANERRAVPLQRLGADSTASASASSAIRSVQYATSAALIWMHARNSRRQTWITSAFEPGVRIVGRRGARRLPAVCQRRPAACPHDVAKGRVRMGGRSHDQQTAVGRHHARAPSGDARVRARSRAASRAGGLRGRWDPWHINIYGAGSARAHTVKAATYEAIGNPWHINIYGTGSARAHTVKAATYEAIGNPWHINIYGTGSARGR